jgi:glycosyltransferase involved in cell wall biosynthesis
MKRHTLVSIIIPVYNEEKDLGNCLSSLQRQSYKNLEIIVVDDGSTDNTRKIAKSFKKVKLIKGEHKGPGFSRNLGARQAKGEILSFVDADMTFDKDYIKNLIQPIIKGEAIGTEEGVQINPDRNNIWWRCWIGHSPGSSGRLPSREGHIFRMIKKSDFLRMGGFDNSLGYADDQTFWIKYGATSKRVFNAICYHRNYDTLRDTFRQSRWIGASIRHPLLNVPFLKYLVPPLLVLLSPLAIPCLSVKKSITNRNFRLFIPWMLIFMTVRYFGLVSGIFRKIYLDKNVR